MNRQEGYAKEEAKLIEKVRRDQAQEAARKEAKQLVMADLLNGKAVRFSSNSMKTPHEVLNDYLVIPDAKLDELITYRSQL